MMLYILIWAWIKILGEIYRLKNINLKFTFFWRFYSSFLPQCTCNFNFIKNNYPLVFHFCNKSKLMLSVKTDNHFQKKNIFYSTVKRFNTHLLTGLFVQKLWISVFVCSRTVLNRFLKVSYNILCCAILLNCNVSYSVFQDSKS